MSVTIQLRRGSAAEWASANPVLAAGEIGLELDTTLYKIGDGSTAWNSLLYKTLSNEVEFLTLDAQETEPAVPDAGTMRVYSKSYGGRQLLAQLGPSGVATPVQAALWANGYYLVRPGTTTAPLVQGGPAMTAVGTVSHPTLASTNMRTSLSRWNCVSAGTADAAAEQRVAFARVWRGDAAGLGGFFLSTTFAMPSGATNERAFIGLHSSTSALATTTNPTALTNVLGVGFASGAGGWSIMHNDASGSVTAVALGSTNFPTKSNNVYRLNMFAAPNGSNVMWQMQNLTNGTQDSGTITTDMPASTTFLAFRLHANNGGTAATTNYDCMGVYLETDL